MDIVLRVQPLVGFVLVLVLCHGMMWTIGYLAEGRWLQWNKQFYAFVYGDILLAIAVGFSLWENQRIGLPSSDHWSQLWWVKLLGFVGLLAFGIFRWAVNDWPSYTIGQSASPTKLYHDTLFVVVGYLVFLVVTPLIGRSWFVLVPILLLGGWAFLGMVLDAKAGWKAQYAHVDIEWPVKYWVRDHAAPLIQNWFKKAPTG
ncbi:hypothetical protein EOL96_08180 [Candidatus Saccharibacteria bacterium]|nr:hypothetical protein [Candidatus Saccharibacteria bacterium]